MKLAPGTFLLIQPFNCQFKLDALLILKQKCVTRKLLNFVRKHIIIITLYCFWQSTSWYMSYLSIWIVEETVLGLQHLDPWTPSVVVVVVVGLVAGD